MIQDVVHAMVELVEGHVSEEMKAAGRGALMHDGWTLSGVHYVGCFAVYVIHQKIMKKTQQKTMDR